MHAAVQRARWQGVEVRATTKQLAALLVALAASGRAGQALPRIGLGGVDGAAAASVQPDLLIQIHDVLAGGIAAARDLV